MSEQYMKILEFGRRNVEDHRMKWQNSDIIFRKQVLWPNFDFKH